MNDGEHTVFMVAYTQKNCQYLKEKGKSNIR